MSALERPAPSCNLGPNENKTVFSYRPAQLWSSMAARRNPPARGRIENAKSRRT
jgi:hypothetical protein